MGLRMNDPDDLEIALNKGWKNEHCFVICTDEMTSKSKSTTVCILRIVQDFMKQEKVSLRL
jgi:hypothetical protein